jgi:hypothetical protein
MSFETFKIVVMSRIETHKKTEADNIERIRAEEQAKAEAAVKAKAEAEIVARFKANMEAAAAEIKAHETAHGAPQELGHGRPDDLEIIGEIMNAFNVSYGTACDYILEVAENLRNSP